MLVDYKIGENLQVLVLQDIMFGWSEIWLHLIMQCSGGQESKQKHLTLQKIITTNVKVSLQKSTCPRIQGSSKTALKGQFANKPI